MSKTVKAAKKRIKNSIKTSLEKGPESKQSIGLRSYKTIYCHNTSVLPVDGWSTVDKRGSAVITDHKNRFYFQITFGKRPRVRVYRTHANGDLSFEVGRLSDLG